MHATKTTIHLYGKPILWGYVYLLIPCVFINSWLRGYVYLCIPYYYFDDNALLLDASEFFILFWRYVRLFITCLELRVTTNQKKKHSLVREAKLHTSIHLRFIYIYLWFIIYYPCVHSLLIQFTIFSKNNYSMWRKQNICVCICVYVIMHGCMDASIHERAIYLYWRLILCGHLCMRAYMYAIHALCYAFVMKCCAWWWRQLLSVVSYIWFRCITMFPLHISLSLLLTMSRILTSLYWILCLIFANFNHYHCAWQRQQNISMSAYLWYMYAYEWVFRDMYAYEWVFISMQTYLYSVVCILIHMYAYIWMSMQT